MIYIPHFSSTIKMKRKFLNNLDVDINTLTPSEQNEIKGLVYQCWAHSKEVHATKTKKNSHRSPIVTRFFFNNKLNFKHYVRFLFSILLFEYNIQHEDIPNKISHVFLRSNGYRRVLDMGYTVFEIVDMGLGDKNTFKPWDFKGCTNWNSIKGRVLAKQAVKWLIEEKLTITDIKTIPSVIGIQEIKDNNLFGLYATYGYNIGKMIMLAYPNQFKPYEFITDWDRNPHLIVELIHDFMSQRVKNMDDYYEVGKYIHTLNDKTKVSKYLSKRHDLSLLTLMDKAFPGFEDFYEHKLKRYTFNEAKDAIKRLNIRTYAEYLKRYKEDPKLPSGPLLHYQKKWSELSRIAK